MITGTHLVMASADADADRAFLRDVLGWSFVHAAGPDDPWLIFRLPPAEAGIHPTEGVPSTQLYLLCDDLDATTAELREKGVELDGDPHDQGWGIVTGIRLPSGASIGLYQPRHATAYDAEG
jgi:predicted enzyme related to lactoylglutathione lyase